MYPLWERQQRIVFASLRDCGLHDVFNRRYLFHCTCNDAYIKTEYHRRSSGASEETGNIYIKSQQTNHLDIIDKPLTGDPSDWKFDLYLIIIDVTGAYQSCFSISVNRYVTTRAMTTPISNKEYPVWGDVHCSNSYNTSQTLQRHYNDVIMSSLASQITSLTTVY